MTSRERVHAGLGRNPVDRVPIFMWFHPQTTVILAELLDIPPQTLGEAMGDDVRMTWVNNNYAMEGVVHEHDGDTHTDEWGITWEKEGAFNQIIRSPLAGAVPETWDGYVFPQHRMEELLARMEPVAAQSPQRFVGCDVSPCVFEMYNRIRGMEDAIMDLALRPEDAEGLMSKCADFAVELSRRAIDTYPLDWLWTGDDVASQRAMLMSPQTWRDIVKPHLARVVAVGRQAGLWVAYHCCGAIRPIIGDLIEIGIDVLNPIQHGCPGMGAASLKRDFGAELSFMGGVDTQGMLPVATPAEVEDQTRRLIETMTSDGGGYILAASHTVPPETPVENIFAMYRAAGLSREEIFDTAATIRASAPGGGVVPHPHSPEYQGQHQEDDPRGG